MKKAFIGIDPGVSGYAALLGDGVALLYEFKNYELASTVMRKWMHDFNVVKVTIEHFTSRPGKGHWGASKLHENLGFWIGFCYGVGMVPELVRPQEWQSRVVGPRPKTEKDSKERSLGAARELFPNMADFLNRKMDHNRADALNITYYGVLMYNAEQRRIEHGN